MKVHPQYFILIYFLAQLLFFHSIFATEKNFIKEYSVSQPQNISPISSSAGIKQNDGLLLSNIFNQQREPSISTDDSIVSQKVDTSNNFTRKSVTIASVFSSQINCNASSTENSSTENESEKLPQLDETFANIKPFLKDNKCILLNLKG